MISTRSLMYIPVISETGMSKDLNDLKKYTKVYTDWPLLQIHLLTFQNGRASRRGRVLRLVECLGRGGMIE